MAEEGLEALRVLRAASCGADGRTHHQRHLDRTARHVAHLGRFVDQLIHGQKEKVSVLHVGDRPQAGHGRADGQAGQAQFGDGRIQNSLVAELVG